MKKIMALLILALTAACSLTPAYQRPALKVPDQWREGKAVRTDLTDWWFHFKSPELIDLEGKALKQNLDLRAARARIDQAKASEKIVNSVFFPQADLAGGFTGNLKKVGGGSISYTPGVSASVDVSYELDLFGANRASSEAAHANFVSSLFDREALMLVISSEVAQTYADVLALKGRIYVAQQNRDLVKKTLDILQVRFKAGAIAALDVEQEKTELSNADASISALENNLTVAMDALAVLMGEAPQTFKISASSLGELEVPSIAPGQPSELLQRRPDIHKAEADLIAANADIGVARAAFFPSVNLGIVPSITASPLANPATTALSLVSSLSAPLFRGGSLEGGVELSEARKSELAENYRHTVLTAFQEVEDALAATKAAEKRRKSYTDAVRSADKAYTLAYQQFKAGAVDYLTLLVSERSLLTAKDNLVSANLDRLTAVVALYKALGGGWRANLSGL